jgi:hypothetical protein
MARESYPVWRGPVVVGIVVIACFCWWWWWCPCDCDCQAYHEVVIDDECVASPWELDAQRGDFVLWTNLMPTDTLEVVFTTTSPFAVDSFKIPPGLQTALMVQDDADITDHEFHYYQYHPDGTREECTGGSGNPKVVVGGGGG